MVIDPGFEPDPILAMLDREGLRLAAILNTHGHVDHIAGKRGHEASLPRRSDRDRPERGGHAA